MFRKTNTIFWQPNEAQRSSPGDIQRG